VDAYLDGSRNALLRSDLPRQGGAVYSPRRGTRSQRTTVPKRRSRMLAPAVAPSIVEAGGQVKRKTPR